MEKFSNSVRKRAKNYQAWLCSQCPAFQLGHSRVPPPPDWVCRLNIAARAVGVLWPCML